MLSTRSRLYGSTIAVLMSVLFMSSTARAGGMLLADRDAWPGVLLQSSSDGRSTREVYRRSNPVLVPGGQVIPRIASIAIVNEAGLYFCSGLDSYIIHLSRGREQLAHTANGQVRYLAATGKANELLYSVVATPQGNEWLADGAIYTLNTKTGMTRELPAIHQSDVDYSWWGAFAIRAGEVYIGTIGRGDRLSAVFVEKFNGEQPELVYQFSNEEIHGMAFSPNGDLFIATAGPRLLRVRDMRSHSTALTIESRQLSDVAFPIQPRPGRPSPHARPE